MNPKPVIIFEDENLLVLNKPAGLTVHEGNGAKGPTLVDYLRSKLGAPANKLERAGLVHRLDKDTSGVILVAKTEAWFNYLKGLFKNHKIQKTYTALVHGTLTPDTGRIDIPIVRDTLHRTKFRVAKTGRQATTNYQVVKHLAEYTLVAAKPVTGRTHQIRVHLAAIGHPIVGDTIYGRKEDKIARQFLHAEKLEFVSPEGKALRFEAPLPEDLETFYSTLH
jgi:23S rRNA pseudouridine1911/1915/1917 synthase